MTRIIWPYNVLPPAIEESIRMLHHPHGSVEIITGGDLDPRDPRALADLLQAARSKYAWVYSVNNLLQIVEAMRRGYTFRVVEIFNPPGTKQSPATVQTAAIFQADLVQGIHRIWLNQDFVQSRSDIPVLDKVPLIA